MKPYWLADAKPSFPALNHDTDVDVAVIGAGITGASICYWLSGKCNVALIEADMVASKASGRNAGFLLTGTADHYSKAIERYGHRKARTVWRLTQENHDLLERHIFNDDECEHKRSGSHLVAASEKEMQDINESATLLQKDGFSCKLISESEINEILSSKHFHGAAFNASDGEVNPFKLANALVGKAHANGTKIFEQTSVKHITEKNGFSIKTNHATVHSDYVVLATNAYTPLIHPGLNGMIEPVRGQMLATNPLGKRFNGVFYSNDGYEYWRQVPDGSVLAGGFREMDFNKERGYRMATTNVIQRRLEKMLTQLSLEFDVEHRWSGIMGFSKDHLPIIGPLPGSENLLISGGYSGHGLGFSFLAGRMISEVILSHRPENMEIFAPTRFG